MTSSFSATVSGNYVKPLSIPGQQLYLAKEKKTEEKAREEIKIFNYDNMIELDDISACAALQLDAPEFSNTRIILESLCQTPEREGTQLSGPETPQKLNSSERITEASQIVKRKLDF
ncbi:uncharacterized protein LOC121924823 isoform X2 [Sceloporus undulatus]|uniref:uncharacterized protein LOC121924823 isoform X2 n=1 Tax=Sceloporus undulatus TaxID=8520 RepID=UPI001C4AEDB5|nr:uncharacterized protein LOC121924823 isoform X2 [Sceloporus undulatus]